MAMFLVFGPTFFTWFYLETLFPQEDRREGFRTMLLGGLILVPFLVIPVSLKHLFPFSYEGWALFGRGIVFDLVLPLCCLVAGYAVWLRKRLMVPLQEQVRRFLVFGAGGLFPLALHAHFSFQGWEEGLQYLLIPFLWIQLLYLGAVFLGIWYGSVRWQRFLILGAGIGWMVLLGWFAYLYRVNIRFIPWILIPGSFVAATIGFPRLIEKIRYL
ncbi:MAG: hypothetical protein Kow009_06200 [Spirochaetales bacterium]